MRALTSLLSMRRSAGSLLFVVLFAALASANEPTTLPNGTLGDTSKVVTIGDVPDFGNSLIQRYDPARSCGGHSDQEKPWHPNPPLVISSCALLFTLFSFWWMHWRRGRIRVGSPRTFAAACKGKNDLLLLQLPLIFYNDGAAVQVIWNLRLRLSQNGNKSVVLPFNNTVDDIATSGGRAWARQFAIQGRQSFSAIFVFQRKPGNFAFEAPRCTATLEVKLNQHKEWKELLTFELETPQERIPELNSGRLVPHDNEPVASDEDSPD